MTYIKIAFVALALSSLASAQGNCYTPVDASSPATLRTTLHQLIDDHLRIRYTSTTTDTWDVLETADQHPTQTSSSLISTRT